VLWVVAQQNDQSWGEYGPCRCPYAGGANSMRPVAFVKESLMLSAVGTGITVRCLSFCHWSRAKYRISTWRVRLVGACESTMYRAPRLSTSIGVELGGKYPS
jgi:hypothetical protein